MRLSILPILCLIVLCCQIHAAEDLQDFTKIDPGELKIQFVESKKDAKTGFIVGGRNDTGLIRGLSEINGRSIEDLEWDMRPARLWREKTKGKRADDFDPSEEGFLGPREKLIEVLAADNEYVVDRLELTHQELARHLLIVASIAFRERAKGHGTRTEHAWQKDTARFTDIRFIYHGREYQVGVAQTRGFQRSPFSDECRSGANAVVINHSNGKQVAFALLVPLMIERYGFYEGKGTPYRVEPRDIVNVFDFLKKNGDDEPKGAKDGSPIAWTITAIVVGLVVFVLLIRRRGSKGL